MTNILKETNHTWISLFLYSYALVAHSSRKTPYFTLS